MERCVVKSIIDNYSSLEVETFFDIKNLRVLSVRRASD